MHMWIEESDVKEDSFCYGLTIRIYPWDRIASRARCNVITLVASKQIFRAFPWSSCNIVCCEIQFRIYLPLFLVALRAFTAFFFSTGTVLVVYLEYTLYWH